MSRMIHFTKMHGAGNDYVYVDCFTQTAPAGIPALARAMSDRHTGVGADGLILIDPSAVADARMQMWNADGSSGEMCGNGIRCVAKYLYDRGIVRRDEMRIETAVGLRTLQLTVVDGVAERVRVNMGCPILSAADIPTTLPGDPPIDAELMLDAPAIAPLAGGSRERNLQRLQVTCVSMGNPHCVTFVDDLCDDWVLKIGPALESHPAFPHRVNAEFVHVVSPGEIQMRVWERGSGETQACGSGASAALVAGVLTGRTQRSIICHLPGGDLELEWADSDEVTMTGPAVEVFSGDWPLIECATPL